MRVIRMSARNPIFAVLVVALGLSIGCNRATGVADAAGDSGVPFSQTKAAATDVTIPAGSTLEVRMQSALSSANAFSGQRFDAVLDQPVTVDGKTVIPSGADVTGRVVAARHSGRLHDPGYLRITLASINLSGKPVELETSSLFFEGSSHKTRNVAMIGGGAGGGALIGALAGGGKGALIGSAIGAGAGTGTAYATGKKEVGVGVERRLMFRLTQPLVIRG